MTAGTTSSSSSSCYRKRPLSLRYSAAGGAALYLFGCTISTNVVRGATARPLKQQQQQQEQRNSYESSSNLDPLPTIASKSSSLSILPWSTTKTNQHTKNNDVGSDVPDCSTLSTCQSCIQQTGCHWCQEHDGRCTLIDNSRSSSTNSDRVSGGDSKSNVLFPSSFTKNIFETCQVTTTTCPTEDNVKDLSNNVFEIDTKPSSGMNLSKTASTTTTAATLDDSNTISEEEEETVVLLDDSSTFSFSDPNYDKEEWVFDMIELQYVWSELGLFGNNIHVRINDGGMDTSHPEFDNRVDLANSCPNFGDSNHGTAVAAIVGGGSDNGICSVGIAPAVTFSACNAITSGETFLGYKTVGYVDVSQNSYERPACRADNTDEDDERLRKRRKEQENVCPFSTEVKDRFKVSSHPCDECLPEEFDTYNYDGNTQTGTISTQCSTSIVDFCKRYYEYDTEGCSEFLDILIGGDCTYQDVLSPTARTAITDGIINGRNGKGIIFVFASGNSFKSGDVTNIKSYQNSRYTISVGSVGQDGVHASYSTPGANLLVSAPGGDISSGEYGTHYTALSGNTCGSPGIGTSFACPVVSGVVALMLEANPDLTWRDVQQIIIQTATRPNLPDDSMIDKSSYDTINGAGLWHSNLYGFGIINAKNAVLMAQDFAINPSLPLGMERMIVKESGSVNLLIQDDPTQTATSTMTIGPEDGTSEDIVVESVAVFLDLLHFSRGDVEVVLTSPMGTKSVLHPGKLPETTQLRENDKWKLLTLRNWGENPYGEWKLEVTDVKEGGYQECSDAPFYLVYTNVAVTCWYLAEFEICADGGYNQAFFNSGNFEPLKAATDVNSGMTMTDACCLCGGGVGENTYNDQLREWKVVIYGHDAPPATALPSSSPTVAEKSERNGSSSPTIVPTTTPSDQPTTSTPTAFPTVAESKAPSPLPSLVPTKTPSDLPSTVPTVTKSVQPTSMPSLVPSTVPSLVPSSTPSRMVSNFPSSRRQSEIPSDNPSDSPSRSPSEIHSDVPNEIPTDSPSDSPSDSSSANPTETSSVAQAFNHSKSPSDRPTLAPTKYPTDNMVLSPSPTGENSSEFGATPSSEQPNDGVSDEEKNHTSLPSLLPSDGPSEMPPRENDSTLPQPTSTPTLSLIPSALGKSPVDIMPPSRTPVADNAIETSHAPSVALGISLIPTPEQSLVDVIPEPTPTHAPSFFPTIPTKASEFPSGVSSMAPTVSISSGTNPGSVVPPSSEASSPQVFPTSIEPTAMTEFPIVPGEPSNKPSISDSPTTSNFPTASNPPTKRLSSPPTLRPSPKPETASPITQMTNTPAPNTDTPTPLPSIPPVPQIAFGQSNHAVHSAGAALHQSMHFWVYMLAIIPSVMVLL